MTARPAAQRQRKGSAADQGGSEESLFVGCPACREMVYRKELERRLNVCPSCGHHARLTVDERLRLTVDRGSFVEIDAELTASDPLDWQDGRPYAARLAETRRATGRAEALTTGWASLDGIDIGIALFDFDFLGGSMGAVVGEKFVRLVEGTTSRRCPVVTFAASGGARMQEGSLSLVQMARVSAAIVSLREAGLPYLCVLTDPTTGGVAASLAMLGDVQLAEPGARIGFAGPRVIEQTIGEKLPEDFQSAESVLAHGMIDCVVPREEMRETLARLLRLLTRTPRRG